MLLINRKLRIANDVDEQNMRDSSSISFLVSVDILSGDYSNTSHGVILPLLLSTEQ